MKIHNSVINDDKTVRYISCYNSILGPTNLLPSVVVVGVVVEVEVVAFFVGVKVDSGIIFVENLYFNINCDYTGILKHI